MVLCVLIFVFMIRGKNRGATLSAAKNGSFVPQGADASHSKEDIPVVEDDLCFFMHSSAEISSRYTLIDSEVGQG